jgi:tRNA nucleotidyltransferase/poly(A) polymerase
MPDYIYLLQNRLSADQRSALSHLRDAAREAEMILFLTGDAVRDLTSGHAVRDVEVAVHGNALKLKKSLEKAGAKVWGEDPESRSLFLCFPGTVRVDVVSSHRTEYPKPGKAVYHPASIQEDLRRRDFTANAMAISLNEGSFGLLMDPLNGVADIEARTLRLVSNYGFLEEPSLMIRATRYKVRLGWELDPRTQARYENAKAENVIEHISAHASSRELEQIGHEEDGLKVLKALEEEGWMNVLCPGWTSAKADENRLKALHDLAVDLLVQGVHADISAAQMQLLTSGLSAKDLASLKKSLLRPGFVEEWDSLDSLAAGFQKVLLAKQNVSPSASFKLFTSYDPEAVLWLGFTGKTAAVQERYNQFLKVWPEAKQRIPHALMQEMRITPELPNYAEIVHGVFLNLIDEKLGTPEEMRAYLEPFSPPAPPPPVSIKRSRVKREAKAKVIEEDEEREEDLGDGEEEDLDLGEDEELDLDLGKGDEGEGEDGEDLEEEEEGEEEEEAAPVKASGKKSGKAEKPVKPAKLVKPEKPVKAEKPEKADKTEKPDKAAAKSAHAPAPASKAKPAVAAKPEPVHKAKPAEKGRPAPVAKKAAPAHVAGKGGKPAAKAPAKPAQKAHAKPAAKAHAKPAAKIAHKTSAKHKPAKPAAKKAHPVKPAKKH